MHLRYIHAFGERYLADGKVYGVTGEHTPPNPIPRGNVIYCLDAYTGELIWDFPGIELAEIGAGTWVASGTYWVLNRYDNCWYMFGKGKTATTVSAPETTIPLGDSVLIQGTVTDQSPDSHVKDTPAIADAYQTQWMEYLFMQWPMPTNATGVPVFLQAIRSDGTIVDITHVTTDIMGHYEYTWTPPDQDTYKILAMFEGSESYWASSAQTGLSVGAAAPTPSPPEAAPDATLTIIGTGVGTGIAIIIAVAVAAIMILRKRP